MATSNTIMKCYTCQEEITTYMCTGCSEYFCIDDLMKHREELKLQFHQIEDQRNQFAQTLDDQKNNRNNHPLIQQITQWERISIEKIRQTAEEQRNLIQQYAQTVEVKLRSFTEEMQKTVKKKDFNEIILKKLQIELEDLKNQLYQTDYIQIKQDSSSTFINKLFINITPTTTHLKWKQHAATIAGGNREENQLNQFNLPVGIYVDDQQQNIYVADCENHRIIKWKFGERNGEVVAGGNEGGNRIDQLNYPYDVILDQNKKSLIICDGGNERVVRWSLENQNDRQILIENISCVGLTMNNKGDLFVSDYGRNEVRRWKKDEKQGTIVAGGNGNGDKLNQLYSPGHIFVDQEDSIYVSDCNNHRVMKWLKGAKEGIIVSGGQGYGNSLKQLSNPQGLVVNENGDVFVADYSNHRVMCWPSGSEEGRVVVGGNGQGEGSNQLNNPGGLVFDRASNLYVVDTCNHRIQRFDID